MTSNVINARVFWTAKVNKIIQRFDYGIITIETLVDEMCLMGYERDQVLALINEGQKYEQDNKNECKFFITAAEQKAQEDP